MIIGALIEVAESNRDILTHSKASARYIQSQSSKFPEKPKIANISDDICQISWTFNHTSIMDVVLEFNDILMYRS